MGGVANQADLVLIEPRRAPDRDQRARRIVFKIVEQIRHERHGIGKFFLEESTNLVVGFGRGETARSFEFPKQRAGERAVGIRQRDHHETFPGPDVERVLLHTP